MKQEVASSPIHTSLNEHLGLLNGMKGLLPILMMNCYLGRIWGIAIHLFLPEKEGQDKKLQEELAVCGLRAIFCPPLVKDASRRDFSSTLWMEATF